MEDVCIDEVKQPERLWEILDVMKDAWQMKDYTEAVPPHLLRAVQDNGGLLLVAYDGNEIIGFVFGIIGRENNMFYHYSHMVGVKRRYRGKGVGLKLKLAQREWAIRNGYNLVMWTYDPYQGLNAKFNFTKLGVICNRYYKNYYGVMKDGINKGMISDRFKVEWWVNSRFVIDRINRKGNLFPDVKGIFTRAELVVETLIDKDGDRMVSNVNLNSSSKFILIEIPSDINVLKEKSIRKANDWKLKLRPVFEEYFRRGYYTVDFISLEENVKRRNFYLLVKEKKERILNGEFLED